MSWTEMQPDCPIASSSRLLLYNHAWEAMDAPCASSPWRSAATAMEARHGACQVETIWSLAATGTRCAMAHLTQLLKTACVPGKKNGRNARAATWSGFDLATPIPDARAQVLRVLPSSLPGMPLFHCSDAVDGQIQNFWSRTVA